MSFHPDDSAEKTPHCLIKPNGLIEQWGNCTFDSTNGQTFTYLVEYKKNCSVMPYLNDTSYSDKSRGFIYNLVSLSTSSVTYKAHMTNSAGIASNYSGL